MSLSTFRSPAPGLLVRKSEGRDESIIAFSLEYELRDGERDTLGITQLCVNNLKEAFFVREEFDRTLKYFENIDWESAEWKNFKKSKIAQLIQDMKDSKLKITIKFEYEKYEY